MTTDLIDQLLDLSLGNRPVCPACGSDEIQIGRLQVAWHSVNHHEADGTAIIGDENDWGDPMDLPAAFAPPGPTVGWCGGTGYDGSGSSHAAAYFHLHNDQWEWA